MSYAGRYHSFRQYPLGDATTNANFAGCTWHTKDDVDGTNMRIGVATDKFRQLQARMGKMGFPSSVPLNDRGQQLVVPGPGFGAGITAAYLRFGAVPQWGFKAGGTSTAMLGYFGLDWGCCVAINQELYKVISGMPYTGPIGPGGATVSIKANSIFAPSADGFVRVLGGTSPDRRDNLMDRIVERLIRGGYLLPLGDRETIASRTDALFTPMGFAGGYAGDLIGMRNPKSGLWQACNELGFQTGTARDTNGRAFWPGGSESFGEGPGYSNVLRIHPEFLQRLFLPLPRELAKANQANKWRRTGAFVTE